MFEKGKNRITIRGMKGKFCNEGRISFVNKNYSGKKTFLTNIKMKTIKCKHVEEKRQQTMLLSHVVNKKKNHE